MTGRPPPPGPDLTLEVHARPDATVVRVLGELDLAGAPVLRQVVGEAAVPGAGPVVIDCSGVTFLDSTGLKTLVEVRDAAAGAGDGLVLAALSQPVERLLDMVGMLGSFAVAAGSDPLDISGALPAV